MRALAPAVILIVGLGPDRPAWAEVLLPCNSLCRAWMGGPAPDAPPRPPALIELHPEPDTDLEAIPDEWEAEPLPLRPPVRLLGAAHPTDARTGTVPLPPRRPTMRAAASRGPHGADLPAARTGLPRVVPRLAMAAPAKAPHHDRPLAAEAAAPIRLAAPEPPREPLIAAAPLAGAPPAGAVAEAPAPAGATPALTSPLPMTSKQESPRPPSGPVAIAALSASLNTEPPAPPDSGRSRGAAVTPMAPPADAPPSVQAAAPPERPAVAAPEPAPPSRPGVVAEARPAASFPPPLDVIATLLLAAPTRH